MAYSIELVAINKDIYRNLENIVHLLNQEQSEFVYNLPPERLRYDGLMFNREIFSKNEIYDWVRKYKSNARGRRDFIIVITDSKLERNLYGDSEALHGVACFTTYQVLNKSSYAFILYFILRYSLKFVSPHHKNHKDTRGCFYDYMGKKRDINVSINRLKLCDECMRSTESNFNHEIHKSIFKDLSSVIRRIEKWYPFYDIKYWLFPLPSKKTKKIDYSWLFTSIGIGIIFSLVSLYYLGSKDLSFLILVLTTLYAMSMNPRRRYFRGGMSLMMLGGVNIVPSFKLLFENDSSNSSSSLTLDVFDSPALPVVLVIIGFLLVILDFVLERERK